MKNIRRTVTGGLREVCDDSVKEEDKPYQDLRRWLQKRGMDGWYADLFVSWKLCTVETIAKVPLDSDCVKCYMFLHRLIEDARDTVDLSEMSWSEAKSLLASVAVPLIIRPELRHGNRVSIPDSVPRAWLAASKEKPSTNSDSSAANGVHPQPPMICIVSVTPPCDNGFLEPLPPHYEEQEQSRLSAPVSTRKRSNSSYENTSPTMSRRPRRNSVFAMDRDDDQTLDVPKDSSSSSSRNSRKNTLRRVKHLILGKVSTNGAGSDEQDDTSRKNTK